MKDPMFPETYEEWRHFITAVCGLELTPEFVEERLLVWRDANCEETRRFRKRYGDAYWKSILAWYEEEQQAQAANH